MLHEVADRSDDRALMLTGAGGNFSSGADLSGADQATAERKNGPLTTPMPIVSEMRHVGDIILRLHRLPKPTIAKIDGRGRRAWVWGWPSGCDLVVASDEARLIEIFPRRGLALDGGNSWLLPRLIGLQKAKELAFFGEEVSGTEAAADGAGQPGRARRRARRGGRRLGPPPGRRADDRAVAVEADAQQLVRRCPSTRRSRTRPGPSTSRSPPTT